MTQPTVDDFIKAAVTACQAIRFGRPINNREDAHNLAVDQCIRAIEGLRVQALVHGIPSTRP